jgi:hypothetical protein
MFKRKAKGTPSPEASLSRLYADVLNAHRYERLEWDVSWTVVPIFQTFAGFYPLPFRTQLDAPLPFMLEGAFGDLPVYLDKELPDGVAEIRTMNGEVLATANFN